MTHKIRVWDLPTRTFHWLLALSMVGLVITGNVGGNAMVWHFRMGYAVLALLLFRLVWGVIGGHWSRFVQFIYAPSTVISYIKGRGRPEHAVGHNPLGAFSVFGLLAFLLAQVASGLFSDDEIAFAGPLTRFISSEWVSQLTWYHKEVGKSVIIALVVLHVTAILFYLLKKKENLVRPMVLGDKEVSLAANLPSSKDTSTTRVAALIVFGLCAALVYGVVSLGA
jgi:cytochrome b